MNELVNILAASLITSKTVMMHYIDIIEEDVLIGIDEVEANLTDGPAVSRQSSLNHASAPP